MPLTLTEKVFLFIQPFFSLLLSVRPVAISLLLSPSLIYAVFLSHSFQFSTTIKKISRGNLYVISTFSSAILDIPLKLLNGNSSCITEHYAM
jgi:hypothetical protein